MEFQLSYFKSWKMMLWKCCIQYASKFGKCSSGRRTEKGQFSFQSQRKAMPRNAQTTAQLHSSHILVKQQSKSSKSDFKSTWTVSSQIFKLDFKKTEEPGIKLPTFTGSWKSKRVPEKSIYFWFVDYAKALTVWIMTNCGKFFKKMGIPDQLTCLLRNLYAGQESIARIGHGTTDWFQIRKGVHQGRILLPCLFNFYAEYIMWNARLDEAQTGIKIAGEISVTSYMQMTPPLCQRVKKS